MDWIGIQCNLVIQSHSLSITLPLNHTPSQSHSLSTVDRRPHLPRLVVEDHTLNNPPSHIPTHFSSSQSHSLSNTLPLHHTPSPSHCISRIWWQQETPSTETGLGRYFSPSTSTVEHPLPMAPYDKVPHHSFVICYRYFKKWSTIY